MMPQKSEVYEFVVLARACTLFFVHMLHVVCVIETCLGQWRTGADTRSNWVHEAASSDHIPIKQDSQNGAPIKQVGRPGLPKCTILGLSLTVFLHSHPAL